jgi:hypothetical protein
VINRQRRGLGRRRVLPRWLGRTATASSTVGEIF